MFRRLTRLATSHSPSSAGMKPRAPRVGQCPSHTRPRSAREPRPKKLGCRNWSRNSLFQQHSQPPISALHTSSASAIQAPSGWRRGVASPPPGASNLGSRLTFLRPAGGARRAGASPCRPRQHPRRRPGTPKPNSLLRSRFKPKPATAKRNRPANPIFAALSSCVTLRAGGNPCNPSNS